MSSRAGEEGENVAEWVLSREGWKFTGRHVTVHGHQVDRIAIHPATGEEWLIEVKVWGVDPSGKDTVKKALADAAHLRLVGETRPIMLIMSHKLGGLLGDMIRDFRQHGAITDVRVIHADDHSGGEGG